MIQQGEIYWSRFQGGVGSEMKGDHPVVILQCSRINQSRINTVLVALLTTNLKLAGVPGNLLLKSQESGLPQESVVNITQLYTVDKSRLERKVGKISADQLRKLFVGIDHLLGR
jgi:mRNA interferase MazF